MRIVKLQSENIKRLHAVEITPDGSLITIGGRNGQGKSSVLDSVSYALGGNALVPAQPIRAGEAEAKVVVDLGDLIVTRRFARDKFYVHNQQCAAHPAAGVESPKACNMGCPPQFGETRSTLIVTNKDGARYPSPQAVLDKLLGRLTFDPLAFARDEPKRQHETLRKLVGLDVTWFEATRAKAAQERQMLKKSHDIKAAQLAAMPHHPGAGFAEISMDEISQEMLRAEELRRTAEDTERRNNQLRERTSTVTRRLDIVAVKIAELKNQLTVLEHDHEACVKDLGQATDDQMAMQLTAEAARHAVPDVTMLRAKLTETEATNVKVRANNKHAEMTREVAQIAADVKAKDDAVKAADAAKDAALKAVAFPVAGLGLSDDGVTFNDVPFEQASTSEQLRVSVAIGLVLNPTLKVLLVRNGNALDDDGLLALAAQAETAGAQVWCEYVSTDDGKVSVMIEDGAVKAAHERNVDVAGA